MKISRSITTLFAMVTLGLAVALPAQARSLDDIQSSGYIKIVTTSSSPPHGFLDPESNELEGIMFQLGRAIAQHLDVEPRFNEVPFSGLIPSLKSGRADLMSGPLFITDKRAEQVGFTQPIYGWGEGVAVRSDSDKRYREFSDFSGQHVGALVSSVQHDMLKELDGTDVTTYKNYVSLIADLRAGRIDAAIIDPPSIAYQLKSKSISGVELLTDYNPMKDWKIGMAVEKGNEDLRQAVDAALTEMKSSGELLEILSDWGLGHLMAD